MPFDPEEYVPQSYELIPYRFVRLVIHRSNAEAARMLRERASHLTTLGREQGQKAVQEYARHLTQIASLIEGPPQWKATICPGIVDLCFRVDPERNVYRIYVTRRRKHHKRFTEE